MHTILENFVLIGIFIAVLSLLANIIFGYNLPNFLNFPLMFRLLSWPWRLLMLLIHGYQKQDYQVSLMGSLEKRRFLHSHRLNWLRKKVGLLEKKIGFCLESKSCGHLDDRLSSMHLLGACPPGTGKTESWIQLNLLQLPTHGSIVCIDPKASTFKKFAGVMQKRGFQVSVLNMITPEEGTHHYNPLTQCTTDEELTSLAHSILVEHQNSEPFWRQNAVSVFLYTSRAILNLPAGYEQYKNLVNVAAIIDKIMLATSDDDIKSELKGFMKQQLSNQPTMYTKFLSHLQGSTNTLSGIISTLSAALGKVTTPELATISAKTTLPSVDDMRKSPHCVFICPPAGDAETYAPFLSFFFTQFFKKALRRVPDPKTEQRLYLLGDELGNIPIPGLPSFIALCREFMVHCFLIFQSPIAQLKQFYKESWEIVWDSASTKLFAGGLGSKLADELSRHLGEVRVRGKNGYEMRPLLHGSQIRELSQECLCLSHNRRPAVLPFRSVNDNKKLKRIIDQAQQVTIDYPPNIETPILDLSPWRQKNEDHKTPARGQEVTQEIPPVNVAPKEPAHKLTIPAPLLDEDLPKLEDLFQLAPESIDKLI